MSDTTKKRKPTPTDPKPQPPAKRSRAQDANPADALPSNTPNAPNALIKPHEHILAALSPRHNVLAASVISSTRIGKRTAYITSHLLGNGGGKDASDLSSRRPRLALLYARTVDAYKMITVAELCKRTMREKGSAWFQYNELFELPEEEVDRDERRRERRKRRSLEGAEAREREEKEEEQQEEAQEEEDGGRHNEGESRSRLENAVLPPARTRTTRSLRIFLSSEAIPELKSRPEVTVQSSEGN